MPETKSTKPVATITILVATPPSLENTSSEGGLAVLVKPAGLSVGVSDPVGFTGTVNFVNLTNGQILGPDVPIAPQGLAGACASGDQLQHGNNTVQATYSGDANFAPSTSEPVTVRVRGG